MRCPDGTDLEGHLLKAGTDTDEACDFDFIAGGQVSSSSEKSASSNNQIQSSSMHSSQEPKTSNMKVEQLKIEQPKTTALPLFNFNNP